MRVLKPNPGELVDRQTILTLKINHLDIEMEEDANIIETQRKGNAHITRTVVDSPSKVNPHPFFDELDLVQNHLKEHWIPDIANVNGSIDKYDALYDKLLEVNTKIWDLEDQARVLRDAPVEHRNNTLYKTAAEVLFTINDLNDERAKIVGEINSLWNINTKEKLHVQS